MTPMTRIENALKSALAQTQVDACPPKLGEAMRYAVFPGGGRVRPRLCLAVAHALGDDAPQVTDAAAASIELLHCASLVHDDLPCFDDAAVRRGKPSVHRAHGESLAVLAGDGLIVLAFETLAARAAVRADRLAQLISVVGRSVSVPYGIVAGQAWESEPEVDLALYQQAKTGALFAAATSAGAAAAGADPRTWRLLGEKLGEAYQVADDLRDVVGDAAEIGKPVGRDAALGRPSAADALGVDGALRRLEALVGEAVASIPDCERVEQLRDLILAEARGALPRGLLRRAA